MRRVTSISSGLVLAAVSVLSMTACAQQQAPVAASATASPSLDPVKVHIADVVSRLDNAGDAMETAVTNSDTNTYLLNCRNLGDAATDAYTTVDLGGNAEAYWKMALRQYAETSRLCDTGAIVASYHVLHAGMAAETKAVDVMDSEGS
jgi:hypothetical protein